MTAESIAAIVAAMSVAQVETVGELVDYCAAHGTTPQQLAASA